MVLLIPEVLLAFDAFRSSRDEQRGGTQCLPSRVPVVFVDIRIISLAGAC